VRRRRLASFDHIRYRRHDASAFLFAFDLIKLKGDDLRREPLAVRRATLASLLARAASGLRFNEHSSSFNEHSSSKVPFSLARA
jgi:ATP-dependent DNA ligase